MVHHAIRTGQIPSRTVGRFLVIPHEAWAKWKAQAQGLPAGHVQLSTLREPLGIASDKLSEFARMGFVPRAVRVKPFGQKGVHTTKFGSWYVPQAVAEQLLADRRAGRPMPWHGKPLMDNLKVTYQRWRARQHPATCRTCAEIWGAGGPPEDFTAYVQRYPAISHGAKRHLTMPWTPGLTVPEVAQQAGKSARLVRLAIANGMLAAELHGRKAYVTRTDATRWIGVLLFVVRSTTIGAPSIHAGFRGTPRQNPHGCWAG